MKDVLHTERTSAPFYTIAEVPAIMSGIRCVPHLSCSEVFLILPEELYRRSY